LGVGSFDALEGLEDAAGCVRWDADSCVGDGDVDGSVACNRGEFDAAAGRMYLTALSIMALTTAHASSWFASPSLITSMRRPVMMVVRSYGDPDHQSTAAWR
jgi:hypothetical protein